MLYESDNELKFDFFLKPIYMWLFIGHMLAAGKPFKFDEKKFLSSESV